MSFKQFQIFKSLSNLWVFIELIGDIRCFGDTFFKTKRLNVSEIEEILLFELLI